jgi:hypothetical protein
LNGFDVSLIIPKFVSMHAKKEQISALASQVDPLASQPLAMGVEGLIATIEDELLAAIRRARKQQSLFEVRE